MKAFFLAAGFGTRLKPFTEKVAKPAIPFLGLPQLLYSYFITKEMGALDFVHNTHHNADTVNLVFEKFKIKSNESYESEILNSAGGLSFARDHFINEKTFLVINADTLFIYKSPDLLKNILKDHIKENRLATLFAVKKENCGIDLTGLDVNADKSLKGAGLVKDYYKNLNAEEIKNISKNFRHFIGLYIFSNEIFNYLTNKPDNLIYDILLKLPRSESQKVIVETLESTNWYELGTMKDYKLNHLTLSKNFDTEVESFSNSFLRTHNYFKTNFKSEYPYLPQLEQQILRSI